jgi:hypothetical protein
MMLAASDSANKRPGKTALEIFKEQYLRRMDKYSDYFFNGPWPKKFNFKESTKFTREDLDFIDAEEDDYADRVLTVMIKKNISLKGFNYFPGLSWTQQAYTEQFVRPRLKSISDIFLNLAKTGANAEEILAKMKQESNEISVIHWSMVDLIEGEQLAGAVNLKASEVLELIHTKEGLEECTYESCKTRLKELKKNV